MHSILFHHLCMKGRAGQKKKSFFCFLKNARIVPIKKYMIAIMRNFRFLESVELAAAFNKIFEKLISFGLITPKAFTPVSVNCLAVNLSTVSNIYPLFGSLDNSWKDPAISFKSFTLEMVF